MHLLGPVCVCVHQVIVPTPVQQLMDMCGHVAETSINIHFLVTTTSNTVHQVYIHISFYVFFFYH